MIFFLLAVVSAMPQSLVDPKTSSLNFFDKLSAPGQSFARDIKYRQIEIVSNLNWIEDCATACYNNQNCLGFFEQTHLCPFVAADDKTSNPNKTPGKGCYRICGFYEFGVSPRNKPLSQEYWVSSGSVWARKAC